MGLLTLLAALAETISDSIKEKIEKYHAMLQQKHYEHIDFNNIAYVTLDDVETAYRIETEEEFDPVMSDFLTQQDGWQHYETKTVEYEVEDGVNYYFTIKYKNGTQIQRKFHERSEKANLLLKYCNKNEVSKDDISYTIKGDTLTIDGVNNETSFKNNERFAVIDFETTGLNYKFSRPPMDEIISVAIIDQDENVLLNTYCDTVNIKSWDEAQRITGISPRDVKGYPTFAEIMPKVLEILSSYDYVISYNIPFDKSFLESYVRASNFSAQNINWGPDPMKMFMEYLGEKSFLKLEKAARHFGYKYKAHNALEDAKAALFVYNAVRKFYNE